MDYRKSFVYLASLAAAVTLPLAVLPALRASLPTTASSNLTTVYASGGAVSTTQATSGPNSTLTVTSTAPITVLNWGNFWDGTAAGGTAATTDSIVFTLPGATSSILNEIAGTGTTAATTLGNLSSNGKVFLLNPHGFLALGGGTINTAGFYLSTLQENVSYFEQNGTLQVFSSTPPVGTTTGSINVSQTISTVGGSGDVRLAGNGVVVNGTINGNAYIVDVGAATPGSVHVTGAIASTTVGGVTVGGNLTISGTNASVVLASTGSLSVGGNLSVTTGGGANGSVELSNSGNTTVTGSTVVNTVGSTNGNVTSGNTIITAGLAITTGTGTGTGNGSVQINDVTAGSSPVTVTGAGGNSYIDDSADATLTLGTSTIAGNFSVYGNNGITTQNFGSTSATPATVTMTSSSNNTLELYSSNGKISFNGTGNENFAGQFYANGAITITTTGNVFLNTPGTINPNSSLSITSTGGSITQGTATGDINAGPVTLNAATITLTNPNNNFGNPNVNSGGIVLLGGASGIRIVDASSVVAIAGGTATTGNVTITNTGNTGGGGGAGGGNGNGLGKDDIVLGSADSDTISIGGNLTLNLSSAVVGVDQESLTTKAGTISVTGNTTINSSGLSTSPVYNLITLGNSAATPTKAYTFGGPVSVVVGSTSGSNVTLYSTASLGLGTITIPAAGNLVVTSSLTGTGNSGISNAAGVITVPGTTTLAAGSATSSSNIQIGTTASPASLTGTVTVGTGNNVTLVNSLSSTLVTGANPIAGLTSVTETANGAPTAVTLGGGPTTGNFSNVSVSQTGSAPSGGVSVNNQSGALTLTNWSVGGTSSVAVSDSAGAITLGAGINDSSSVGATITDSFAGASISDTANSPVAFYGPVSISSAGGINLSNNTLNNLGAVTLALTGATNNGNITYTEGGGVNLAGITAANGTYSGTVSITSVNSIILEGGATGIGSSTISLPLTSKLNLTATSAGGAVLLTSTIANVNQILAPVSIAATGNSVIWDQNNLLFAGVNITSGTFVANTTEAEGITIGEQAGTTVYSYGNDTFKTAGGAVTLGNSGNNFGAIAVDTTVTSVIGVTANPAGANATIKEFGGNNYASVNTGTGGNFSTTSEQSIILETGNTGVSVGGTTTLSAPNGSIFFTATGNDFNLGNIANTGSTLKVTTTGNATITDTGGTNANAAPVTTLADGTNVTGTLSLTLANAGTTAGKIRDNGTTGNITIGTGIFIASTSGTSSINFTGGNNAIANLEIKAGTGATVFNDNASVNILPGTAVSGAATISSGGSITMTTAGPVSFLGTLGLNSAGGNITFSDTSALFNAKVTAVDAAPTGDVNFSGLSLATNFNGVAPAVTTASNATYYQAPGP